MQENYILKLCIILHMLIFVFDFAFVLFSKWKPISSQ